MRSSANGALGLYSAVGDALTGRRLGFASRRAAIAARFARHRGRDIDAVHAAWAAGLLAEIGHVQVVLAPSASERTRDLALADAPLYGARIVAALDGIPAATADLVRWHREHDDGTGFPDRLRWDGIPTEAAALGIAHAFVALLEDPQEPRGGEEALFAILAESGRRFRVELARAFREFVTTTAAWDEPFRADLPAPSDAALIESLAARLDARSPRTAGRSDRLAAFAAQLAGQLELDAARAGRLGRLLALGRAGAVVDADDFDPLSRFARDRRAVEARRAATIAAAVADYAGEAPLLTATATWYEDGGSDRLAGVLALGLAVDALGPHDAPRLVTAAAGSQFDPAVVRAYLAASGAST